MIIKASLHGLRQPGVSARTVREAVTDIDDEVVDSIGSSTRCSTSRGRSATSWRSDLNLVCRESAAAAQASGPGTAIHLDLDRDLPRVTTDAERLRSALVNMLVNARARRRGARRRRDGSANRRSRCGPGQTAIALRSSSKIAGVGIEPADLHGCSIPYFTTKRGGTGLGLAIAKNLVEGLHGTIAVTSTPGAGTAIHI
jgi:signal transduction histidine kinase